MNFFTKLFAKLTSLLVGKPAVDMKSKVTALYPDSLVLDDIFPKSQLNVTFVVLPSVDSGTLPENLSSIVQRNDGTVTFVFTGSAAKSVALVAHDPKALASLLAERLISHSKLVDSFTKIMEAITNVYNKIMPGEVLTAQQLLKKALGMAGMFLANQEAYKSASDFYKALLTKFIIDGRLTIDIPEVVSVKLTKLGLDKVANNPAATLAIQVVEVQINNLVEVALKRMKGDIQVY
jgi:hypothetical protein